MYHFTHPNVNRLQKQCSNVLNINKDDGKWKIIQTTTINLHRIQNEIFGQFQIIEDFKFSLRIFAASLFPILARNTFPTSYTKKKFCRQFHKWTCARLLKPQTVLLFTSSQRFVLAVIFLDRITKIKFANNGIYFQRWTPSPRKKHLHNYSINTLIC